jgi:hypothetical protein
MLTSSVRSAGRLERVAIPRHTILAMSTALI